MTNKDLFSTPRAYYQAQVQNVANLSEAVIRKEAERDAIEIELGALNSALYAAKRMLELMPPMPSLPVPPAQTEPEKTIEDPEPEVEIEEQPPEVDPETSKEQDALAAAVEITRSRKPGKIRDIMTGNGDQRTA